MARFRLYTKSQTVVAQIRNDTKRACLDIAEKILRCSNSRIDSNQFVPGVALGAGANEQDLKASGYIATADDENKEYEAAKARAGGGKNARFAPAAVVSKGTGEFRVKVAYALDRATLMHDGYYDPRADKQMQGVKFLKECAEGYFEPFKEAMKGNCARLQTIQETRSGAANEAAFEKMTPEQKHDLIEAAQFDEIDSVAKELGRDLNAEWRDFTMEYGDQMKRERGGKTGRVRRLSRRAGGKTITYRDLVETYHWETAAERLHRIVLAFANFRQGLGAGATAGDVFDNRGGEKDELYQFVRRKLGSRA